MMHNTFVHIQIPSFNVPGFVKHKPTFRAGLRYLLDACGQLVCIAIRGTCKAVHRCAILLLFLTLCRLCFRTVLSTHSGLDHHYVLFNLMEFIFIYTLASQVQQRMLTSVINNSPHPFR